MSLMDSQSVAVDGDALRRIREQKRLTQLYVSKVVGVTTDTVSRWENNRYPTIRRENALKLADALEVDLADILKQEINEQAPEEVQSLKSELRRVWLGGGFGALLLIIILVWFFLPRQDPYPEPLLRAERILPPHVAPGHQLLVQVVISADTPLKGIILKEEYPAGWRFLSAEPEAASVDDGGGMVRWIFRNPVSPLHVYYRFDIPVNTPLGSEISLTGELIANPDGRQFSVPVRSTQSIRIKPFHWADTNADLVIDDVEILLFSELSESTIELDEEWYLIERIWHAGSYRWDNDNAIFIPVSTEGVDKVRALDGN